MAEPPIAERHKHHFHQRSPIKEPVRAATTANITISTALNNGDTLDGVTLATGDRVLVKDQSTGSQNGIYIVGASPVRAYDLSTDDPNVMGAIIRVLEGTANAGTTWANTNTTTPTIGSTSLTFAAMAGGSGAPTTADYLVGTAQGGLSAEIVVGTTPGGELGGTWASPTVDATHSGSTHDAATNTHIADTTDAHDASAISVVPTGGITSTDVQAALAELDGDISAGGIPATIFDAKGDLIAASAADTAARVAVGANGSSLRAASGASAGIEWQLNKYDATTAPTVNEDTGDGYSVGSVWIDVTGDAAYICVDASSGAAVWLPFDSGGASWEGAWSAGTYTTGQIVEHNDVIYQANATTTDEPPGADWDVLYTAPAGGGPLLYIDSLALHASGDDFSDPDLGSWTLAGGLTTADTTAVTTEPYDASCVDIRLSAQSDRMYKAVPAPASGNYEIYLTLYGLTNAAATPVTAAGGMIGLYFSNDAGAGTGCSWYSDGLFYNWIISANAYSGTGTSVNSTQLGTWLGISNTPIVYKLSKSGTTITAGVSVNGGLTFKTCSRTDSTTFTRMGIIRLFTSGGTDPTLRVGRFNVVEL